jgi:2,4-dienoyl-CoA reductase (NADPH2)
MEGGLTLDDCVEAAKRLEDESADYINLSDGFYEKMKYIFPDTDGLLLEHGEPQAFKRALKIPVITPSIHNPDIAEKAIANGETDMIEMGRQLLADPDWANKVRDGKAGEITTCDRDCFCNIRAAMFLPVRCKLNRNLGREQYMPEYEQPPFEY